jgi:hypothetical protein
VIRARLRLQTLDVSRRRRIRTAVGGVVETGTNRQLFYGNLSFPAYNPSAMTITYV